ncbi:5695_t:CDS:2 [Diversispora eburnea]|uniref:5695_t:CDS:1 n=1 Tax=Diversispora eburnea TaxID=1213867 RepID=A0A9N8UWQ0_9GLOM|nr:5695_t:CDS:2 [Diversispora eburnea]
MFNERLSDIPEPSSRRFTFDEPIKYITKKNAITFTLYGYCIDDQCSTPSMLHSFDKIPSSSEISSSSNDNKKRLDVPDVTDTVTDTTKDIIDKAPKLLENLKDSLNSFTPKIPSVNISGIHLEAWSFLFLTIATITLLGKFGKNIINGTCKCVSRGIRNIKDKISKRNEKDDDEKEMVEAV